MHPLRTVLSLTAGAALLLGAAGCGEDTSTGATDEPSGSSSASPTSDPSADALPSCESVWVEGADLPKAYDGCAADGTTVPVEIVECSSGQRIVTYDDHYWALRGHRIGHAPAGLDEDKAYARVLYSCRA
ncbi:hypothetical protein [Nocardioides dongkuii]|uniref:hypothetical protein n=1 Tax=Nocardioides dongkuii TaxID=2760089 RepID=UPI0015F84BF9|nr:hypothetical protein [Nocardioides dongkuii]